LTVRKLEGTQTRLLQKIKESLDSLNEKMEVIIELQKHSSKVKPTPEIPDVLDVMTLLSLPDHLRKTAITGYLKKERRGRKAYFCVDKEGENKTWQK